MVMVMILVLLKVHGIQLLKKESLQGIGYAGRRSVLIKGASCGVDNFCFRLT